MESVISPNGLEGLSQAIYDFLVVRPFRSNSFLLHAVLKNKIKKNI